MAHSPECTVLAANAVIKGRKCMDADRIYVTLPNKSLQCGLETAELVLAGIGCRNMGAVRFTVGIDTGVLVISSATVMLEFAERVLPGYPVTRVQP
jgi:hypothetical protein